jgi:hypothetical protein
MSDEIKEDPPPKDQFDDFLRKLKDLVSEAYSRVPKSKTSRANRVMEKALSDLVDKDGFLDLRQAIYMCGHGLVFAMVKFKENPPCNHCKRCNKNGPCPDKEPKMITMPLPKMKM